MKTMKSKYKASNHENAQINIKHLIVLHPLPHVLPCLYSSRYFSLYFDYRLLLPIIFYFFFFSSSFLFVSPCFYDFPSSFPPLVLVVCFCSFFSQERKCSRPVQIGITHSCYLFLVSVFHFLLIFLFLLLVYLSLPLMSWSCLQTIVSYLSVFVSPLFCSLSLFCFSFWLLACFCLLWSKGLGLDNVVAQGPLV